MPTTGTIAGQYWTGVGQAKPSITWDWTDQYSEQSDQDGTIITAVVQTDATTNTYQDFQAAMLGFAQQANPVRRVMPEPHPRKNWLYCTHCALATGIGYVSEGTGNKIAEFNDAGAGTGGTGKLRWNVTWQDLGYRVRTDVDTDKIGEGELSRFITRRSTGLVEALPMPGTSWRVSPAGRRIPEPRTKPFTTVQLEYTWWWVPEPLNEATWIARLNTANSAAFDTATSGANFATETCLFTHYEKSDPVRDARGKKCYHVTFHFLVRTNTDAAGNTLVWNAFWRANGASGPGFYRVVSNDAFGVAPFSTASHNGLFA